MLIFFGVLILFTLNGLTLAEVDISNICLKPNLGAILPHPDNCSDYIVCGLEAIVQHCERGLHFDATQKVCSLPQFAKCQQGLSTAETIPDAAIPDETIPNLDDETVLPLIAIEVETGAVVHPMKDYNPENVMCRHYGAYFLAHPQSCRSYYLCAYGRMHQVRCGQGALWSYKRQQCEISYEAECYHKTNEEEMEIAKFEKICSTPGATITDGQPTNNFHPTDSYHTATAAETTAGIISFSSPSYIPTSTQEVATTVDGVPTNTFHPTGSIYTAPASGTVESTTHLMLSKLPISTKLPTSLPLLTSSKAPNSSNPYFLKCPQGQKSYLAHPKNCSKYFMCIKGMPIQTSCPAGLLWDTKNSFCALPKYVKCFQ